jgi:mono/diheme cytochrome c family protein
MKNCFPYLILLVCSILFFCGFKRQQTNNMTNVGFIQTNPINDGKVIYMKFCISCHQIDGSGVPDRFPPLKKNKVVNGDKSHLIKILLEGLKGEINVDGEIYNQIMPPASYLSDKDISDVLSFVRKSFGNNSGSVSTSEVTTLRKQLNK